MTPHARAFLDRLGAMADDDVVDLRFKSGTSWQVSSISARAAKEAMQHVAAGHRIAEQMNRLRDQHVSYNPFETINS